MSEKNAFFALMSLLSLGLFLPGCDYTRDTSPKQSYDDVGEIDVDSRDKGYAVYRHTAQDTGVRPQPQVETSGARHAHEVGEMSLEESQPVKHQAPKTKATEKPVGQAPVRNVPAPAPAPEYRVPDTYVAAQPVRRAVPVAHNPVRENKPHHCSNVGEIEVGY
jgi:hypothetical protein